MEAAISVKGTCDAHAQRFKCLRSSTRSNPSSIENEEGGYVSPKRDRVTASSHPLLLAVVLTKIFSFFDQDTLKIVRQVSRVWSSAVEHEFKRRLVKLKLHQVPKHWNEAGAVRQLEDFISFGKTLDLKGRKRDFVYWDLEMFDIQDRVMFLHFLQSEWQTSIRCLTLSDFSYKEYECVLSYVVTNFSNLVSLSISVDDFISEAPDSLVGFARFHSSSNSRYTFVNEKGEGASTALKTLTMRMDSNGADLRGINPRWSFIALCPNLQNFNFCFPLGWSTENSMLLREIFDGFTNFHPRHKIRRLRLEPEIDARIHSGESFQELAKVLSDFVTAFEIKSVLLS